MPGINTSGLPNTSDYWGGAGRVMVSPLDAIGRPSDNYRQFGNTCVMELEFSSDTEQHRSCLTTGAIVDSEIITSLEVALSLEPDEISFDNMSLFSVGTASQYTQPNGTANAASATFYAPNLGYTGATNVLFDQQNTGRSYPLYFDGTELFIGSGGRTDLGNDQRVYPDNVGNLTIGGEVEGAGNWEYDSDSGTIFVYEGGNLATLLDTADGANTTDVYHNADGTLALANADSVPLPLATNFDQVEGLSAQSRQVSVRADLLNKVNSSERVEIFIPKVTLLPNGTFQLISEDAYASLPFSGTVSASTAGTDVSKFFTMRRIR